MRELGFGERSGSAGAIRIVRRRATELSLDASHFRGKRRWSDAQLRQAVMESHSWQELLSRLGLSVTGGASPQPHIKSHAIRLGLDTSHLAGVSHVGRAPSEGLAAETALEPQPRYLRVAAGTLAAAWFALRGCVVSFPIEPAEYDLLAQGPAGISRVQVKSTTFTNQNGYMATVGHHPDTHSRRGQLLAYDPDEIDLFFIVDGDMTMYLIPSRAIAGRVRILLRTYTKYIVGNARGLLGQVAPGAAAAVPPA